MSGGPCRKSARSRYCSTIEPLCNSSGIQPRETQMNQPEDIDRQPPIGVFLYGESFLDAARHLQEQSRRQSYGCASMILFTISTAMPSN